MLESWFQATLQLVFIASVALPILYVDLHDSMNMAVLFSGLVISCLSVLYGLSTYNLRKILRTDPSILGNLWFTLSELCTTAAIFLYFLAVWFTYYAAINKYYQKPYGALTAHLVFTLFIVIPFFGFYQLSKRMLSLKKGYFSIDYRINLSLKCQELDSVSDMVMSRRRLVIVNMIYILVTTSAVTIWLYCVNINPLCIITSLTWKCDTNLMYYETCVVLAWYTACIISFLQNAIELLYILIAKKSFLNWAFKAGLKHQLEEEERLDRLREQKELDKLEEYNLWGRNRQRMNKEVKRDSCSV